ncbi:hypothetical protein E1264_03230 [Actinomadura sp. KC216]|uniref:hypothetical protein n=1 Tax=Actinomadura sp. KC216 TaxID=2530370 RepID=UPI001052E51B|nr:hypothetical protein [Actinomadura sp. KC216]TDB91021.1 hypothetical protein E1264_03230 [Actinomadura sp. KC216]
MMNKPSTRKFPADASKIELTYTQRRRAVMDDDDEIERWEVSADVRDYTEGGEPILVSHVGDFTLYAFDPYQAGSWQVALEGRACSGQQIVRAIGKPGYAAPLREEVENLLDATGPAYLVLDTARLEPQWRGSGLGAYLAGSAIETLGRGCSGVFLVAGSLPDEPLIADEDVAASKLGQVWRSLGFAPLVDKVYVLNLGVTTLQKNMAAMRDALGLA